MTQKKDACAAGGRGDPCTQYQENREIARTRFRSQVRRRKTFNSYEVPHLSVAGVTPGLIVKPRRLYFVNVQEQVSSAANAEDLRLLDADIDTLFVMSASGRIERVNDPEGSSGPRLFFAGCRFGNVARVRYDVDDRVARKMLEIAAEEPPWRDPDATPGCLGRIVELLSDRQPATIAFHALIYKLSNGLRHEHHPAPIVRGDSPE